MIPSVPDNAVGPDARAADLLSTVSLRKRVDGLLRDRARHQAELAKVDADVLRTRRFLDLAPQVERALEELSQQLFQRLIAVLEEKLTIALHEVLEQPIRLRADPTFKRNSASVDFYIERDGHHEGIMRGQGGSVVNVLSVGLRMFALATLDEAQHRRFLVLDEQDCWLQPELVPRLVKIIHEAGKALGFQVLLISHHDIAAFDRFAERVYRVLPQADGTVKVERRAEPPGEQRS
jgi:ABC-type glutathione transport system ATPase component